MYVATSYRVWGNGSLLALEARCCRFKSGYPDFYYEKKGRGLFMSGLFIAFEGPDGSGKTSALNVLEQALIEKIGSNQLVRTREPGGSRIAEQIRHVILDTNNIEMTGKTEALLYAASRQQHVNDTIRPALANGQLVLCDRYVDSSIVYQSVGRALDQIDIETINAFATDGVYPHITVYFDLAADVGLDRIAKNRLDGDINRLDREGIAFHKKVTEGYRSLYKNHREGTTLIRVDASQSEHAVHNEMTERLANRIIDEWYGKRSIE